MGKLFPTFPIGKNRELAYTYLNLHIPKISHLHFPVGNVRKKKREENGHLPKFSRNGATGSKSVKMLTNRHV